MRCPKCAFEQPESAACVRCGIVFARFQARAAREEAAPPEGDLQSEAPLTRFLTASRRLVVEQHVRHWWEILVNWEQRNSYDISGSGAGLLGHMVEQGSGIASVLARVFLGSHRPLEVLVFNATDQVLLEIERPFYFLNSSLVVRTPAGETLGRVDSRLSLLHKAYDLRDESGRVFATIRSARWRPWTFPIADASGEQRAVISKKWAGLMKEYYTDADEFGLDLGDYGWTLPQRAVIVAAMISIDYDYFENNQGSGR